MTRVTLDGLPGGHVSVEAEVTGTNAKYDRVEHLRYRSRLGFRVTLKVISVIDDECSKFVEVPPTDSTSPDGKRWSHVGQTRSKSRAWERASGQTHLYKADSRGAVAVAVECVGDAPYNLPHNGSVTLPLS